MIRVSLAALVALLLAVCALAARAEPSTPTAAQLVSRVIETRKVAGMRGRARLIRQNGTQRTIRLMTVKMRPSGAGIISLYQVDRSGVLPAQALVVESAPGKAASGFFISPQETRLGLAFNDPFFGSDLTIGDVADDFLYWPTHRLLGEGVALRRKCGIVESRPATVASNGAATVRSWISPEIALPLKVEKYDASGRLLRRITVQRVRRLDEEHWAAARMSVVPADESSETIIEGTSGGLSTSVRPQEFEFEIVRRSVQR